jgi:uncharacterized protein
MSLSTVLLLVGGGLLAGFIDSIAGGGGLVTLPLLGLLLSNGADAIGTNKIVGTSGALVALIVYARAGHLRLRSGLPYVGAVGFGSILGSCLTPRLAPELLRSIIFIACSGILVLVVTKPWWWPTEARRIHRAQRPPLVLLIVGFFVGIYDGAIGPGGGTFMLLALLLFANGTVLQSLALSKLANTASAGFSLISYSLQGHVYLSYGLLVATGVGLGALVGARVALKQAENLLRPLLFVVSALLLWKMWFQV